MGRKGSFFWVSFSCGIMVLTFILLPLVEMLTAPSGAMLRETLQDRNVIRSIWLSIYTAASAAGISFLVGTPLAYLLARSQFRGKHLIESVIDLPIVIPHPVVGIAILGVAGKTVGEAVDAVAVLTNEFVPRRHGRAHICVLRAAATDKR